MLIRMGSDMIKWLSFLLATMAVLIVITIIGCRNSDTPSQVVEKFYKYTQENNCQDVADLVSGTLRPELAEEYVNDCKYYSDKLVSYSIKGETIYEWESINKEQKINENGNFAQVDTEVTLKEDSGKEKTNYPTQSLVKQDGDWKLTRLDT